MRDPNLPNKARRSTVTCGFTVRALFNRHLILLLGVLQVMGISIKVNGADLFYNYDGWDLFYYGADDAAIMQSLAPLASNGVTTVMLSPNVGQAFVCPSSNQITMFNRGVSMSDADAANNPCMSG